MGQCYHKGVVLFPEARNITGLEQLSHQIRRITAPMLYHYATVVNSKQTIIAYKIAWQQEKYDL